MTIKSDQHGFEVQAARPYASQDVAIGGTSLQSLAFSVATTPGGSYTPTGSPITTPNQTLHVRLVATSNCYVAFGANPLAVIPGGMLLVAGVPEYFWVLPGDKIAVIQAAGAGVLNITECVA